MTAVDCRQCKSVNKELIFGLDHTNQIIHVLTSKMERIAFMRDIEAIFYQVLFAENTKKVC